MNKRTFNLTTEPWIKVIEVDTNQEKTVSLIDVFQNANNYRQLAGDMHSQDLAILRLLLAILTTVYSRYDAGGDTYTWLKENTGSPKIWEINQDTFSKSKYRRDLFSTWKHLYQSGQFSGAVISYLAVNADCFDFFGEKPFYQVTGEDYDYFVEKKKKIATSSGQVGVKQINRRISESGHTKALFSPKLGGELKNEVSLGELVRWIITYQNFTGVTDKSKVQMSKKFSNPGGWIYNINPVFAKGETLFETLMLNLILVDPRDNAKYTLQKPVWEYKSVRDYIEQRKLQILPDNLAELYTVWSRMLHIQWSEEDTPTIFSAGIPMFQNDNAFIEPMTTWSWSKKDKVYKPAVRRLDTLDVMMWRNFGKYVNVNSESDNQEPGIVRWLNWLKDEEIIPDEKPLILNSVALVYDQGKSSSQLPAIEVVDNMQMQADVLFDSEVAERWPIRIEDVIDLTKKVGVAYYMFARDIGIVRNVNDISSFSEELSARFYGQLNEPFREWLEGLKGKDNRTNREEKIFLWEKSLRKITLGAIDEVMQESSPKDIIGTHVTPKGKKSREPKLLNIFIARNRLMGKLRKIFEEPKG
ncbi:MULTISPECIES: type I-E CRISPR-associated protein Cse1/CasA [Levilactobacillus]|uniref:type I-E CRISPR-associated protein Cse1/CasA n=1 Tax=Levilactobacillus TaxID=2767886 RepID=UPI0019507C60|nr:type I-E CRISPR-associated protein Cse1/CasA [Levilactobacillus sp. 244-2]